MFKRTLSLLIMVLALVLTAGPVAAAGGPQKFVVSVDNVAAFHFTDAGTFATPVGATAAGPALPGDAYRWTFHANEGDRLSFATMFVQSNDWFFAPDELGIPLYDASGRPITGDVTAYVKLWDAGTEGDETVAAGDNQAPRQASADSGPADPNNRVRQVLNPALPPVEALVQVSLSAGDNGEFTLRIDNVSGDSAVPSPLAPGVGVVHSSPAPLFVSGQPDAGYGLEGLAEDGAVAGLAAHLEAMTGVNTPLAPVAWAVHTMPNALFTSGAPASAGLEALAEDGGPAALVDSLSVENKGAAAVGRGASGPGPIFSPHGNYQFEITAMPGDHLSLATMFVQSNDWFFALRDQPLFDAAGNPISGDVTHQVRLYDAGTEVDETPGFGPNQAPRQAGPNTGPAENGVVGMVTGVSPAHVLHVTITPVP
jgi:hypothetical protein